MKMGFDSEVTFKWNGVSDGLVQVQAAVISDSFASVYDFFNKGGYDHLEWLLEHKYILVQDSRIRKAAEAGEEFHLPVFTIHRRDGSNVILEPEFDINCADDVQRSMVERPDLWSLRDDDEYLLFEGRGVPFEVINEIGDPLSQLARRLKARLRDDAKRDAPAVCNTSIGRRRTRLVE